MYTMQIGVVFLRLYHNHSHEFCKMRWLSVSIVAHCAHSSSTMCGICINVLVDKNYSTMYDIAFNEVNESICTSEGSQHITQSTRTFRHELQFSIITSSVSMCGFREEKCYIENVPTHIHPPSACPMKEDTMRTRSRCVCCCEARMIL